MHHNHIDLHVYFIYCNTYYYTLPYVSNFSSEVTINHGWHLDVTSKVLITNNTMINFIVKWSWETVYIICNEIKSFILKRLLSVRGDIFFHILNKIYLFYLISIINLFNHVLITYRTLFYVSFLCYFMN